MRYPSRHPNATRYPVLFTIFTGQAKRNRASLVKLSASLALSVSLSVASCVSGLGLSPSEFACAKGLPPSWIAAPQQTTPSSTSPASSPAILPATTPPETKQTNTPPENTPVESRPTSNSMKNNPRKTSPLSPPPTLPPLSTPPDLGKSSLNKSNQGQAVGKPTTGSPVSGVSASGNNAPGQTLINLSSALEIADEHNPSLLAAAKNLDLSRADIRIAGEIPNPQFLGYYGWGRVTRILGNPQQLGINETIETAGKRGLRIKIAKSQFSLADITYNATRWDIHSQVRHAYADLAAAEANTLSLKIQAQLLDRMVFIATKRFQAGAAPESEVIQAQLARDQITAQENQAIGKIEQSRIHLNRLLGNQLPSNFDIADKGLFSETSTPQKTDLVPFTDQMPFSLSALTALGVAERLDLKGQIQQVRVDQNLLRQQKILRIPDIQASGGYVFVTAPTPLVPSPPLTFDYFSGGYVSATVNVPIFHNQGPEIARAKTTIEQDYLQNNDLRQQIQEDVTTAYLTLQVSQKNLLLYESKLLPKAQDVLHMAQRSYEIGKTNITSVIVAQQSFQQVRSGYLDTVVSYQTAWADLEKAVGTPLTP